MLEVDFRMFPLFFLFFQDKLTSELAVPSTSLIDMHRADQLILAMFVDYCAIGTSQDYRCVGDRFSAYLW